MTRYSARDVTVEADHPLKAAEMIATRLYGTRIVSRFRDRSGALVYQACRPQGNGAAAVGEPFALAPQEPAAAPERANGAF